MNKLIFYVTMFKSKKALIKKYSKDWYIKFSRKAKNEFKKILPFIPKIGKSIYAFNYKFVPSYIAWYKAFQYLEIKSEEIDEDIWLMNTKMMTIIPGWIMRLFCKSYYESFRRKAVKHMNRQNSGLSHPYDWQIDYRDINKNCFEIDIKKCPFVKLAAEHNVKGLLPGICRMDYLFASLMNNGFERTKTLGDGDDCCNCRYFIKGTCEWAPEKGFINRK